MALFRKLFYRKPPDGLLEICERVYVFDRCFTTDVWEEKNYKGYVAGVISQLQYHYPDVSILAFNFREGESQSLIAKDLSEHDVTIMDYPLHYEGCPLLTMEMINHFLRSSESWLSLGQQNVLLMHCEWGGSPVLAFMLAALLVYRRHFTGEQKTLDMIYKQAPRELLYLLQPLNPIPSQLRYLQYVARRNMNTQWPPLDRALTLDCVIIRKIPKFNGEGGCRPILRIYGQDPLMVAERSRKILFSTPKKNNVVRNYKQVECELVKIDINCHIQGDVVLECISLNDDREKMMFRTMFNTSFIQSNVLILNRDEIDTLWDAKDQFPNDFKTEVLFSEMDAVASIDPVENSADWLNQKGDAVGNTLQQIAASNLIPEKLESSSVNTDTSLLIDQAALEKPQEKQRAAALENISKGLRQSTLEKQVGSFSDPSSKEYHGNKQNAELQHVETKDSNASATSSPVSPHDVTTVEHPSFHGQECSKLKKVSSLPENRNRPLMTDVLASPPPPLPAKDQDMVSVKPLSPAPMPATLLTPPKDKLVIGTVPSPSQPTTPRDQSPNTVYLKDDRTTVSQPDTSRLPLEMLSSPCENDKIFKMEPSLHTFPSKSSPYPQPLIPSLSSPSASIPNVKPLEEKLGRECGPLLSPPPLPHSTTVLEENSASVSVPPQTPASLTPSLEKNSTSIGEPSPPPPPAPPPAPPPPPLHTTPVLNENCSSISGPPQPPPTPPLKERLVSKGGMLPPPPPPLPGQPVKENSSLTGGPFPPPPPPLPTAQDSSPTNSYAVPLPSRPPPPSMDSSLKDYNNLPPTAPVPPPPVPFPKVNVPSSGNTWSASSGNAGNNLPASPSPAPPVAPPPNKNYRRLLSSTMTSRSNSKKLKPLHWLKISKTVQGSFWAEIEKCSYASKSSVINMSELEYFFSVQSLDQAGSGRNGNSRSKIGQKPQKVQLIDHRRAYNCEIMLSKVKIPLHDMLSSVLALADSALDIDQVENLIKFCPTKEEMEVFKGYKGDKEMLGRCEQFMLELMQVPRVESKLRVFSFKIQFQSQILDLRNNLNIVNSAADQIRGSSKLKGILQTILYLGNALNQGTARGSAAGFKLDSLLKLTDTRSSNAKMTLMHYLCKILADKSPELLDFSKDLSSLEPALKIQLKYLAEEMQAISKGMEKVKDELSMSESDGAVSENFCKALKEFLNSAEDEVECIAQLFSDVGINVDSMIVYFGEDPARYPFEQVVATFMSFQRMFNLALEENRKQLEFERKKAEKEAREKQKTRASNQKT